MKMRDIINTVSELVENTGGQQEFKVAYGWKEHKYEGTSHLIITARSEQEAKKEARKYLKNTYPFGGWRILYATELIRK